MDREAWRATVHGGLKELNRTERQNNTHTQTHRHTDTQTHTHAQKLAPGLGALQDVV